MAGVAVPMTFEKRQRTPAAKNLRIQQSLRLARRTKKKGAVRKNVELTATESAEESEAGPALTIASNAAIKEIIEAQSTGSQEEAAVFLR